MSLKRSILSLSVFLISTALPAQAEDPRIPSTAVGPTSEAEASILFDDSRSLMAEKKFAVAVPKLERLVERYPGNPSFTEAHRLLALAYWKLGDPKRALLPMRTFIDALGRSNRAIQARLDLARMLIELGRVQETIATTYEIDSVLKKSKDLSAAETLSFSQSSRLIRARAWIAHSRVEDAERAIDSVATELESPAGSAPLINQVEIHAELVDLRLAIHLKSCDLLSMGDRKPSLDEAQVKNLLERRSICLSEALPKYRELLSTVEASGGGLEENYSREGTTALKSSYSALLAACQNPPAPPPTLSGKPRSEAQTKSYIAERQRILNQTCRNEFSKHIELLNAFQKSVPEKNRALLDEVRDHAQVLRKN